MIDWKGSYWNKKNLLKIELKDILKFTENSNKIFKIPPTQLVLWIILCQSAGLKKRRAMFVMLSVHTSTTVRERQAETVTKDVNVTTAAANINLNLNLKSNNVNCITTSHYKIVDTTNTSNNNCCEIDKTIKRILPITVDTSTILSPSALTSAQPAQISNKFLITELNNYRKPPTVQVSWRSLVVDIYDSTLLVQSLGTSCNHFKRLESSAWCTGEGSQT